MKIVLATTLPGLVENKRIEEEVLALGHTFELLDLSGFSFTTRSGKVVVPGLTDLTADMVIARGIFSAIKSISIILNDLRKAGTKIFDNNFIEHRYSIDKVTDIVKLTLAGIPTPATSYSRNFDDFSEMAKKIGYPVVVKMVRSGKGANIFKLETQGELASLVKDLKSKGKEAKSYLLQEFIPYEHDLRALVIGKKIVTMKRIPAKGEFRANFSLGGEVQAFDLDSQGQNLAKTALKSVDMTIGGVDILVTKGNRRYVLEINHTAGFVGMEKATKKNIGKLWVDHALEYAK